MNQHPYTVLEAQPLPSPARSAPSERAPLRLAAVQTRWHANPDQHLERLSQGIRLAVKRGAQIVCLQELTLSPYMALGPDENAAEYTEDVDDGPTARFALEMARETGAVVHASLYERAASGALGYNTAIAVAPDGTLLARTRKLHIPRFPGYHEDRYFAPGDTGFPVIDVLGARFGFPTCWDQWFPELARAYSLLGAEVLVYPTAIGGEPHLPGFDTQPLWSQMIHANGLANATFMVAVNRTGRERIGSNELEFYGSSFISDPYGRTLAVAPRNQDAVLVADLDLDQRRDWLEFGLLSTRRPELYSPLTDSRFSNGLREVVNE
jgi:N-carbamoylputrescine amidase